MIIGVPGSINFPPLQPRRVRGVIYNMDMG